MFEISKELIETFNTDGDVMDYAEENGISVRDLFIEIAQFNARETECYGCKNAELFPNMYPCICCKRRKRDMFEIQQATTIKII